MKNQPSELDKKAMIRLKRLEGATIANSEYIRHTNSIILTLIHPIIDNDSNQSIFTLGNVNFNHPTTDSSCSIGEILLSIDCSMDQNEILIFLSNGECISSKRITRDDFTSMDKKYWWKLESAYGNEIKMENWK